MLLGIIGQETLKRFAEVVLSKQAKAVFQLIEDLITHGYDLGQFCKELIEYFRNLIIVKLVSDPKIIIEDISLDLKSLQEQVKSVSLEELQQIFKFLLETEVELKRTSYPRFALEMALVRATQLASLQPLEVLLEKIHQLEEKVTSTGPFNPEPQKNILPDLFSSVDSRSRQLQPSGLSEEKTLSQTETDSGPTSEAAAPESMTAKWRYVLNVIEKTKPSLNINLMKGKVVEMSEGVITLGFSKNASFAKERIEEVDSLKIIRDILQETFKITPKIKVIFLKDEESIVSEIIPENGKPALRPSPAMEPPIIRSPDRLEEKQPFVVDQTVPEEDEQSALKKALQIFDGKIPE
jgi:DNA polymerase-3 subunit gamma/tau